MKKTLWTLSALLLICVLALSACDNTNTPPSNTTTRDPQSTERPSVNEGDCIHSFGEWVTVKEATCIDEGESKRACVKCSFEEIQVIERSTVHAEVIDPAVTPTCKAAGKTEGKHCSVCGFVILEQEILPIADHVFDNDEDATCNGCDFTRDLNCKHPNTEVLQSVASTCTVSGLTEGKKCSDCKKILVKQNFVRALGHVEVTDPAVAVTCTKDGKTEGKHCSRCSQVLVAQTEVKAKGHTEVIDPAVAPTCKAAGKTEGKHCSVCKLVLVAQTTLPIESHTYDDVTDEKCNVCGFVRDITDILKGLTVNALGDSYFDGHGLDRSKVWLSLLANKYDIKMNNYGIGGSTVSNYVNKNPMCVRYASMAKNNADIVLLEGGRNDFNQSVPLGTADSRDTKTFSGALNVIIEGLKKKYPNAMIVCISNWNFPGTKNGLDYADYADAMEAVAKRQGVYFIRACDPAVSGIDMKSYSFRAQYCMNPDDISHLNAEGMKIALSHFEKLLAEYYRDFLSKK